MAPFFKKKGKHSKTGSNSSNGDSPSQPSSNNTSRHPSESSQHQQFRSASDGSNGIPFTPPNTANYITTPRQFSNGSNNGNGNNNKNSQFSSTPSSYNYNSAQQQHNNAAYYNTPPSTATRQTSNGLPTQTPDFGVPPALALRSNNNNYTSPNSVIDSPPITPVPSASALETPWKMKKLYHSPFPRVSYAASSMTSETGAIYLMGGLCGKHVYGDMWILEPMKNENNEIYSYISTPIENYDRVPAPRIGHSSVLTGNAFIVFAGDTVTNSSEILDNKLYFFNITSLKWTITSPEGPKPQGRYGHSIAVINFETDDEPPKWLSYLYVFGGQLEDEYFNDVWRFDLSNFRNPKTHWQKLELSPESLVIPPLTNHSMTAYGEKLFVYGGTDGFKVYNNLFAFDSQTNTWTDCKLQGNFKPPALEDHSCALYQNLLFIYGGRTSDGQLSSELYVIDLNNFNCFKILSNLLNNPGPVSGHSLTIDMINEKLIIMGGGAESNTNFTTASESQSPELDQSTLDYPTSVIYEFDLTLLPKFMERKRSYSSGSYNKNISTSGTSAANAPSISTAASTATNAKGIESEALKSHTSVATEDYVDAPLANETVASIGKSQVVEDTPAGVRNSQYGVFETLSDENQSLLDDPISSSTPILYPEEEPLEDAFESLDTNKGSVTGAVNADRGAISDNASTRVSLPRLPSIPQQQQQKSKDLKIDVGEKAESIIDNPLLSDTPLSTGFPDSPTVNSPPNKLTHPLRVISGENHASSLGSPIATIKKNDSILPVTSTDSTSTLPAESKSRDFNNSALKEDTSSVANESANSSMVVSKTTLDSMAAMINQLKVEMTKKVNEANERIVELESSKRELEKQNKELLSTAKVAAPTAQSSSTSTKEISEVGEAVDTRTKVHYENQLLKLQVENDNLNKKLKTYVPFTQSQIDQLESLNGLIKSQQVTIITLQQRLSEEAELKKNILELEKKNKTLELELDHYNGLYGSLQNSNTRDIGNSENTSGTPEFFSKINGLSSSIDTLLISLKERPLASVSNDSDERGLNQVDSKDAQISQLQAQIDELLNLNTGEVDKAKADHELAINGLQDQIKSYGNKLKELEDNYRQSVSSLNNTHRALTLSQNELDKQRDLNKKLTAELEDLKLIKVKKSGNGSRNVTPRIPSEGIEGRFNTLQTSKDAELGGKENATGDDDDEEDEAELDARYGFKIRDLEADLFITSQERDQLKEELVALKKKLYNSK